MTKAELEQEVVRLQTELAYAVRANKEIIEQHQILMDELLESMDSTRLINAGLSVESTEQLTYIHELEACVAATRAGQALKGLASLDIWVAARRSSAA